MDGNAFDLDVIREKTYSLVKEIEDLIWQNWIGLLEDINLVATFEKYKDLFSFELLKWLKRLPAEGEEEKRRNRTLMALLTSFFLEYETRELTQELTNLESRLTIEFEGKSIAYRSVGPTIINEQNRDKRMKLFNRKSEIKKEKLLPLKIKWYEKLVETSRNLGFSNYKALWEELHNRQYLPFLETTELILRETDEIFYKYLELNLKEKLGIDLSDAHITDILSMRRGKQFDPYFKKEKLIPTVMETWKVLGFDLKEQKNIVLDTVDRPKKVPRACIIAVDPPFDVRLTVYPVGGPDDYESFLHESGHAEHMANILPHLDFEYKYFGDRGFTEGLAYLFQRLTINRQWLDTFIKLDNQDEYLKYYYFFRLWNLRRLISEFTYEMSLHHAESLEEMPEIFQKTMKRGTGVEYPQDGFLDIDAEIYVAGYIRATLFEVQLRKFLENHFGYDWWRKTSAGQFLKELYKYGRKYSAEEVLTDLGIGKLEPGYFLNDILSVLV